MSRDLWESSLYLKMLRTIKPFHVLNFDAVLFPFLTLSLINCFSRLKPLTLALNYLRDDCSGVLVFVCAGVRVYGSSTVRVHGSSGARVCGSSSVRVHRSSGVRQFEWLGAREFGCTAVRVYEYSGVRVFACMCWVVYTALILF